MNKHQPSRHHRQPDRRPRVALDAERNAVCSLRVACNTRRKDGAGVGRQAQLLQRHRLGRAGRKRRPAPLQGPPGRDRRSPGVARVGAQDGSNRQAVDIIADSVQFLGSGNGNGASARTAASSSQRASAPRRTSSSRANGPRPGRGADHQPRRSLTMSQSLLIDQILEDLNARDARLRALWQMTPSPAGRGDATRRTDPRAVLGMGRASPHTGAAAQRRVRVPRRVHPRGV